MLIRQNFIMLKIKISKSQGIHRKFQIVWD